MANRSKGFLKKPAMQQYAKLIHNSGPKDLGKLLNRSNAVKAAENRAATALKAGYGKVIHESLEIIEHRNKFGIRGVAKFMANVAELSDDKWVALNGLLDPSDKSSDFDKKPKSVPAQKQPSDKDGAHNNSQPD